MNCQNAQSMVLNFINNKLDKEEKSILEGCPKNVTKYIQELNDDKKMYEDKIKNLQGKIAYAENFINEKLDTLKTFDKQEELSLAQQELSFLKTDQKAEARNKQLKIVENLNNQINLYQNQIETLTTNMINGKKTYLSIKNEPISYCPMCKQQLSDKGRLNTIQNMKTDLENDYSNKIKLETELQEIKKNLAVEKCKLYALGNDNADKQKTRITEVKNQIEVLEKEKSEIDQYNTSINVKRENIQKAKADIQIFNKNIDELYSSLDSNKKAKDVAQKLLINYIEAKMQHATKHLKNVGIKYYTILKDSGEIKQDFIITYKGNEFKNLSRSETIATSLEISNMLNKISGVNLPLFVDDSESCADYNFIEDFSNDTQILIAKVEKPANIKFIKSLLGEDLQKIRVNENTIIYLSKQTDYTEYNRLFDGYILIGTFLIVSIKNNKRVSMKKRDIRKYTNMFKLSKHEKKVNLFKEEFLEEYYFNQRKMKEKNREHNKEFIFRDAA